MTREEIASKVTALIVEASACDPAKVTPEAKLVDDLGLDSLDCVELVMRIEEEFGADITDDDIENAKTVGDVIALANRVAAK